MDESTAFDFDAFAEQVRKLPFPVRLEDAIPILGNDATLLTSLDKPHLMDQAEWVATLCHMLVEFGLVRASQDPETPISRPAAVMQLLLGLARSDMQEIVLDWMRWWVYRAARSVLAFAADLQLWEVLLSMADQLGRWHRSFPADTEELIDQYLDCELFHFRVLARLELNQWDEALDVILAIQEDARWPVHEALAELLQAARSQSLHVRLACANVVTENAMWFDRLARLHGTAAECGARALYPLSTAMSGDLEAALLYRIVSHVPSALAAARDLDPEARERESQEFLESLSVNLTLVPEPTATPGRAAPKIWRPRPTPR